MRRTLLSLCLAAALLLGTAPPHAQAAAQPTDNVDKLTWQQAAAYYIFLHNSHPISPYSYAKLIDFDGDGIQELFLIHDRLYETYGLDGGTVIPLTKGQLGGADGDFAHPLDVLCTRDGKSYHYLSYTMLIDENAAPTPPHYIRELGTLKDGKWVIEKASFGTDQNKLKADQVNYNVNSGTLLLSLDHNQPPTSDVQAFTSQLHQKALQTDLSATQTLAYWNVMEEVSKRYRDDCGYSSVERDYAGYIDPWFEGFFFDVDGDGITELEVIGELPYEYGDTTQYWRELWDFDGTKAYLLERTEPYSYSPLLRDSDYIQFYLTRDQLNRHWVSPAQVNVSLNGVVTPLSGCLCEGNNYIRIRDIAMLLNGTEKQFDICLIPSLFITSTPYTPTGVEFTPISISAGEMVAKGAYSYLPVTPEGFQELTNYPTGLDFMEHADAFVFGGNNFVKLRDIARVLDFYVGWDGATNTVVIDPGRGYED